MFSHILPSVQKHLRRKGIYEPIESSCILSCAQHFFDKKNIDFEISPAYFKKNILFFEVSSSMIAHKLYLMKNEIIEYMKESGYTVKDIKTYVV